MALGIQPQVSKSTIDNEVEKKRDKGGGLLKKRSPENISYVRLLYLPYAYLTFQYLKKKGLMGGKVPHKASTSARLVWVPSKDNWGTVLEPKLAELVSSGKLAEIHGAFYRPVSEDEAESMVNAMFEKMRVETNKQNYTTTRLCTDPETGEQYWDTYFDEHSHNNALIKYANGLGIGSSHLLDVQSALEIKIFYKPWWVAKLENNETSRYLVYDHAGKLDSKMTDAFNTSYDFVVALENTTQEI